MSNQTDATDMYAVHDCFRHEFARLPITVKAVGDGNVERAAVVGGHVLFMTEFLHAHHESEDLLVWPLLSERSPEHAALIESMEQEHQEIAITVARARVQAEEWMAAPGHQERAGLHTTLIALEKALLHHLAVEEQEVVPLIERDLTPEEYLAVGEHSRASFAPPDLAVALGLILDDTTPARGEVLLASMPPEAREGFEEFGRPVYAEYRALLTDY